MDGQLVVTGTSGFIGSELRRTMRERSARLVAVDRAAADAVGSESFVRSDIRSAAQLRPILDGGPVDTVVHLAAVAEALTEWQDIGELLETNVNGLWTVLDTLRPRRVVFASSCAVYGNAADPPASATWEAVNPVGMYGVTKAVGERVLAEWVTHSDASAVIFRFGNVIGPGCRGLIPYLVRHAIAHPDGGLPAQMRGQGRIVRDYVPVAHVARLILAAVDGRWPPQTVRLFNIGTRTGSTNGRIASLVEHRLAAHGLRLRIDFDNPIAHGEASGAVLNVDTTAREFAIMPPDAAAVQACVEAAVDDHLTHSGYQVSR